jgi:hypothetical protein
MKRLGAIAMIAFFARGASAEEPAVTKISQEATQDNEQIVHRHDFATHMGWSEGEVVFTSPRDFRQKSMNDNQLEGMEDPAAAEVPKPPN